MLNVFYKKITSTIVYCEHSIQVENNVQICYTRLHRTDDTCMQTSINQFHLKRSKYIQHMYIYSVKLHYKAPITTDLGSALPICRN